MRRVARAVVALSVAGALGCGSAARMVGGLEPGRTARQRVLFVGNSLTFTNNLPAMVEALSAAAGDPVATRSVVQPGYSLSDHWTQGEARRVIAEGGWSHVVLQQGPSSLPASQADLRAWTKEFDREIRAAGARTTLYMVWPEGSRIAAFPGVDESYANAAQDVDGLLLPAGRAWTIAWRRRPELAFYGPDGFHPSPMGTYLAALVVVRGLTGRTAVGLPFELTSARGEFPPVRLRADVALVLQESADAAYLGP